MHQSISKGGRRYGGYFYMRKSDTISGVFVAGTGTSVGKTFVTAGLTGWLREVYIDAHAIKPAQTGAPQDDDAGRVAEVCESIKASSCLHQFEPALAPRVAATKEGRDICYEAVLEDTRSIAAEHEFAIIEGIGGLRVPITEDYEVIDLIADLKLPVIVVARSGLGTLNHTSLTVEALEDRNLSVEGIILNEFEGQTAAEQTNPDELERMTGHKVACLPPLETKSPKDVVRHIRENIPTSMLPRSIIERIN